MIEIVMKIPTTAKMSSVWLAKEGYPNGHSPERSHTTYTKPPNPPHEGGRYPFNILTEDTISD